MDSINTLITTRKQEVIVVKAFKLYHNFCNNLLLKKKKKQEFCHNVATASVEKLHLSPTLQNTCLLEESRQHYYLTQFLERRISQFLAYKPQIFCINKPEHIM